MQSNRFQAFSDSENDFSEDEQTHNQKQNRPVDTRSRAEKRKAGNRVQDKEVANEPKQNVVDGKKTKHQREQKQPKGVSGEPHPLDKHSGSGLKTHDRKGGAGRGNWGTYKDEFKQDRTENDNEENQQEESVEEEQLTYAEYMQQFGGKKTTNKQVTKGDQDYSQFKKEGCEIIEKIEKVDDRNPTKSKKVNDTYIGMQNTDLLGFRTGLKTYALREEKPREFNNERKPKQTEQKEQTAKEGEETQQENKEEKTEQPKKSYNNNRGSGRGGKGGYKGGDKRQSYNKQAPQKTQVKVNLEDDSLFPKLG